MTRGPCDVFAPFDFHVTSTFIVYICCGHCGSPVLSDSDCGIWFRVWQFLCNIRRHSDVDMNDDEM